MIFRLIADSLAVTHQKNSPMPNQTWRVAVDGAVEQKKLSIKDSPLCSMSHWVCFKITEIFGL